MTRQPDVDDSQLAPQTTFDDRRPTHTQIEIAQELVRSVSVHPEFVDTLADDLLVFEPEPQVVFTAPATPVAPSAFTPLPSDAVTLGGDPDWGFDFRPFRIAGDGIAEEAAPSSATASDAEFLKTRSKGRRSKKPAIPLRGTRLAIDRTVCRRWVKAVVKKRRCSSEDVETLVSLCEGNGDPDDLRANVIRTLQAAGIETVDEDTVDEMGLWDTPSNVSIADLADAIAAALTRHTRLPGWKRFSMEKAVEDQLLEPLIRAKQDLQLGILACERAVESVLGAVDKVLNGSWKPDWVTLRSVVTLEPSNPEIKILLEAASVLRVWTSTGRTMDGRRRREALQALGDLDLSPSFYAAIIAALTEHKALQDDASDLQKRLRTFLSSVDHLVLEHLAFVRRFAARIAADGEDPDDVFQVAFLGLQRSTRRFDPERGQRFIYYCTFWMKQSIDRWRADESAAIRIPVHRHRKLAELDLAIDALERDLRRPPSASELAAELGWTHGDTNGLLRVPRHQCHDLDLEAIADADPQASPDEVVDRQMTARHIADALLELSEREADIIRKRFGIGYDDDMTLEEIARTYGVTRERIRQIEAKALNRFSHPGRRRSFQSMRGD